MANNLQLSITIKNSEKTLFEGAAFAVSSVSNVGKFDVLPTHANFIALIKESVTIHWENQKPQIIPIEAGVIKVKENNVKIILGMETSAQSTSS